MSSVPTTTTIPAIRQVAFYKDELTVIERDNTLYVAMKPIVEALGIGWESQLKRIKRDIILSEGMVMMTLPSPGGSQETRFLPLEYLNGWLFKIDTRRIKNPATKEKIIRYQKECYLVLFEQFNGSAQTRVRELEARLSQLESGLTLTGNTDQLRRETINAALRCASQAWPVQRLKDLVKYRNRGNTQKETGILLGCSHDSVYKKERQLRKAGLWEVL